MHAHRRVDGFPIGTTLLKIDAVVFEKNGNFPKRLKKKHSHNACFQQTGKKYQNILWKNRCSKLNAANIAALNGNNNCDLVAT